MEAVLQARSGEYQGEVDSRYTAPRLITNSLVPNSSQAQSSPVKEAAGDDR